MGRGERSWAVQRAIRPRRLRTHSLEKCSSKWALSDTIRCRELVVVDYPSNSSATTKGYASRHTHQPPRPGSCLRGIYMSIKSFVIGAILSATSVSIAQAQAPENFRIQYDECGVRSLAWDPVSNATEYRVDYENSGDYWCLGWNYLGTTSFSTTAIVDAPDASRRYRVTAIAAGLELGAAEMVGDGIWSGPIAVTRSEVNTAVCESQQLRFSVSVRSRISPLSFQWRINGVPINAPNTDTLDLLVTGQDEGIIVSVAVSNACEMMSVSWSALTLGYMPAPGVCRWTAFSGSGFDRSSLYIYEYAWTCYGQTCREEAYLYSSSWSWSCNHGELQTDHAEFSLHGEYMHNGWWGICGWNNRTSQAGGDWYARGELVAGARLKLVGSVGCASGSAVVVVRHNGKLVYSTPGCTSFDETIFLQPGVIEIQGSANSQGAADVHCDVTFTAPDNIDCNTNQVPDWMDISTGSSNDADHNFVPDECQSDCNLNNIPDKFEIATGLVFDSNTDGIPDICQGAVIIDSATDNLGAPSGLEVRSYTFELLPYAETGVTLTLDAVGDLNNPSEWIDVRLNGGAPRRFFANDGHLCPDVPDHAVIELTREEFNAVRGADGHLTVTLTCPLNVDGTECKNAGMTQLHLQYIGIDTKTGDCNNNQRLDIYEVQDGTAPDCNANRVPDSCDIARGAENDCNSSSIPDSCEIATTPTLDCNTNGMIDSCDLATRGEEIDCDQNGRIDSCQVAETPGTDCNGNLRPDTCDVAGGTSVDIDTNGIPDECQTVTVPGRYGSIQAAIDAAPANEMRIISVASGTYSGPIAFNGKSVIVRGAGAASTVIDGASGQTLSVVRFTGGEPAIAALEGFTIRGGVTGTPYPGAPQFLVGGGIFSINSAANVRDCVLEQNIAAFGAGAYIKNSTGRIERCQVRGNNAGADGGGLQLYGGSPVVEDTVIEGNVCNSRGAGLHVVDGTPTLRRTSVLNNQSSNVVGGISWVPANSPSAFLTIDGCSVTNNGAALVQGGIGIADDPGTTKMSLQSTTVCNNLPRPNVVGRWIDLGGNTVCDCVGDFNVDGVVNGADLGLMLSSWGPCGVNCPYDLNADGQINGADLGLVLSAWGVCGE